MTTTNVLDPEATGPEWIVDPLMDTYVRMTPGMQVRMDPCTGDVPMMEVVNGRSLMVVGFDVAEVVDLGAEHLVLAEELATAACALRDEVRAILATREATS